MAVVADEAGDYLVDDGLAAAVDTLASRLADRDTLARLDGDALRHRLGLLRRLEGATTAGIAATVAALDRAGGVAEDGASSKAEWLKAHTGRSGRDAARVGRLADNLDELPATADALTAGDLTAEAADAIVKATRDGRLGSPGQAETDLLPVATSASPEDLRRLIKRRQHAADGAALLRDETRPRALRRLSLTQRHDGGLWDLHGQVSNEVGVKLRTALDAFDHADATSTGHDADAPADGTPGGGGRRPDQRLADALEAMADRILDAGLAPGTGGIARPHLSVIVDLATIDTDLANEAGDGPAAPDDAVWAGLAPGETAWDSPLSPQALRRLLCDANVSRIVTTGPSQILDVGRATRTWSEPQRRAVNARDRGCRGPACTRPVAWTAIHHIRWWDRDRGATSVDNGLTLCHHCHHLIHDHNWTLSFDPATAQATWTSPTGQVTITRPHLPPQPPDSNPPGSGPSGSDPPGSDPERPPGSDPPGSKPPDHPDLPGGSDPPERPDPPGGQPPAERERQPGAGLRADTAPTEDIHAHIRARRGSCQQALGNRGR